MLSGLIAALAGIILTSRLSSARADAGQGMTLTVVTVVLLGGVNIFGGPGTIPGVVLAVFTWRSWRTPSAWPASRSRSRASPSGCC